MKKFVVLYQMEGAAAGWSAAEMEARVPSEKMDEIMAMWQAWMDKGGSGMVDPGAPLGNSTSVTGASSGPGSSPITGYSILHAASMEDAIKLMDGHPHFYA